MVFACSGDDDAVLPAILSINAGGPAFEFAGNNWVEDEYVIDARTYTNEIDIESTENDKLFHTESFDSPDFRGLYWSIQIFYS